MKSTRADLFSNKKVDTHAHSSSCMQAEKLLDFIKKTIEEEKEKKSIVYVDDR